MNKFNVKFQRDFEVQIDADSAEIAEKLARQVLAQFPEDTCKLLSIIAEGVNVDAPCQACREDGPIKPVPTPPYGRPDGGGSPGTPTIRVPELVDQVANAA